MLTFALAAWMLSSGASSEGSILPYARCASRDAHALTMKRAGRTARRSNPVLAYEPVRNDLPARTPRHKEPPQPAVVYLHARAHLARPDRPPRLTPIKSPTTMAASPSSEAATELLRKYTTEQSRCSNFIKHALSNCACLASRVVPPGCKLTRRPVMAAPLINYMLRAMDAKGCKLPEDFAVCVPAPSAPMEGGFATGTRRVRRAAKPCSLPC